MERQTNRERAVATAADLFIRRGLAQTSMDDVVRESGVAKSNIYYHFKSKEELLLAVVEHHIQAFEQGVIEPLLRQPEVSPMDALRRFLEALTTELTGRNCEGACPFISLTMQVSSTNAAVRGRVAQFFTDQTIRLEPLIRAAMHQGEIRGDIDPADASGLLMSAVEGSLFLAEISRDSTLLQTRGSLLLTLLRPIP
jgi:TetR/AcrR family transcriptional repressor of nem operon